MANIQTATTGQLENAQGIILAQARFTGEHNAPCAHLIEHFRLPQGNKQITVPKVGQMTAEDLTDGVDMVQAEDIGMTTKDLTPAEVGLKVILTDKLVRQQNDNVFKMIGRQMGDAFARKKDKGIIALFAGLGTGLTTTRGYLGYDNVFLTLENAAGLAAFAKAQLFPPPVYCVHHPNAMAALAKSAAGVGAIYIPGIISPEQEGYLRNFWKIRVDQVDFFYDGNIEVISGYDSGKGALFSKSAMYLIESLAPATERERDASLRATEVVLVSDYGVGELDDLYGIYCQYEIGEVITTSTE